MQWAWLAVGLVACSASQPAAPESPLPTLAHCETMPPIAKCNKFGIVTPQQMSPVSSRPGSPVIVRNGTIEELGSTVIQHYALDGTPPLLHATSDEIVDLPGASTIAYDGASVFGCAGGQGWAVGSSNGLAGPLTLTPDENLCSVAAFGDIGFITAGYPQTVQAVVDGSMHVLWRFDSGLAGAGAASYGCGFARSSPPLTQSEPTQFDMLPLDGNSRHAVSFPASPATQASEVRGGPWPFDARALALISRELPTVGYAKNCPLHLHVERDDGVVLVDKVFARDCVEYFRGGMEGIPSLVATDLGPVLDMGAGLFALLDSAGDVVGEPVQVPFLLPGTADASPGDTLSTVTVGSLLVVFTEPYDARPPLAFVKQTVLGCLP